jgi:hypothetical protein
MWGLSGLHTDEAHTQHLVLLRARRERPSRRAAEQRDELAAPHGLPSQAEAPTA